MLSLGIWFSGWPYKLPFANVFLNDFETPTATEARNEPPNNMRNLKATFLPSNTWVVVGGGFVRSHSSKKTGRVSTYFRSKTEMIPQQTATSSWTKSLSLPALFQWPKSSQSLGLPSGFAVKKWGVWGGAFTQNITVSIHFDCINMTRNI